MGDKTMLVVPATVPDAEVRRMPRVELDGPIVSSAAPAAVPAPTPQRLVPDQPTVEQVDQLRRENLALREELARRTG